jgi:ATP-dependent Clp protease ATP-binding subunit ClpA
LLKPALARGSFRAIAATTYLEYNKYFAKDAALERRFQPIHVGEPENEKAILMLRGIKDKYEAYHGIHITDGAINVFFSIFSTVIHFKNLSLHCSQSLFLTNYLSYKTTNIKIFFLF